MNTLTILNTLTRLETTYSFTAPVKRARIFLTNGEVHLNTSKEMYLQGFKAIAKMAIKFQMGAVLAELDNKDWCPTEDTVEYLEIDNVGISDTLHEAYEKYLIAFEECKGVQKPLKYSLLGEGQL